MIVLGLLLFLIHISEINNEITDSRVSCFADNTRILIGIKDEEGKQMLQNYLDKLYLWSDIKSGRGAGLTASKELQVLLVLKISNTLEQSLLIIIIIYHDFLITPRRGSHVKSGKTHTQSSTYTP